MGVYLSDDFDIQMKREYGYYWVKYRGEWIVGNYCYDGNWYVTESDRPKGDNDFEEIDEKRLTR